MFEYIKKTLHCRIYSLADTITETGVNDTNTGIYYIQILNQCSFYLIRCTNVIIFDY